MKFSEIYDKVCTDERDDCVTILLYHGVSSTQSSGLNNYNQKHLYFEDFQSQIKTLKNNCEVVSMNDIVDASLKGYSLGRRSVAVTFDDGFLNNYEVAAPILDELGCPATFYISSGMIDSSRYFWVDQVEVSIDLCNQAFVSLDFGEGPVQFKTDSIDAKINAVRDIKLRLKSSQIVVKESVLRQLLSVVDNSIPLPQGNYRVMTWDQVREIDDNGLFIVGGHSFYHDIMSQMSDFQLQRDIELTLGLLEYHLRHPVFHYAYPEGRNHHFDARAVQMLKNKGVLCSPTAIYGQNNIGDNLFNLRRITVDRS